MQENELLRSQKNSLFQAIQTREMDPADFVWKQDKEIFPGKPTITICHRFSEFYFVIDEGEYDGGGFTNFDYVNSYHYEYAPGNASLTSSGQDLSWDGVVSSFGGWLGYLKREIDSPDLWETITQERKLEESVASDDDNSFFSSDEQKQISERVLEIEQFLLKTHNLNEEHQKFVRDRMEYLIESSERLGKKDWKSLAFGVLLSTAMGIGLNGVEIGEVMRFVGGVLGPILGGTPLLP